MTKLTLVKDTLQVEDIAQLADIIWREYYTPILGDDQVTYMLTHLQSEAKITQSIADRTAEYFIVEVGLIDSGYVAIEWHEDALFLSKLYLLKEMRGQGHASMILQQLMEMAKNRHRRAIELTVNKYNDAAIAFYEKKGFERIDAVVSGIGGGYVMDDFIYRLSID